MVSDNAAMALDDYIAKSKIGKGGRGGNRGGGRSRDGGRPNRDRGGDRGGDRGRVNKRRDFDDRPPRRGRNMDDNWEHDLYSGGRGGRASRAASKLLVDNLDFGVTDADMEELFGEFGDLRKATILYDRSGRSTGQAEIEFTRASDAERAKEQYNGVPLDGRAMTITIVGGGGGDDGGFRSRIGKRDRSRSRSPRRNYSPRGGRRGGGQRNGGGGRGGGRGGQREKKEEVTQEQLDKEMEEYLNQKK